MLTEYIDAAMSAAQYEILPEDGSYYGEIPDFQGVFANATTLARCQQELREVLEGWVLFRVSRQLSLPTAAGIDLAIKEVA